MKKRTKVLIGILIVISIIAIVIVTIVMDFLVSFSAIVHDRDNPLFKEFVFISF